MKIYSYLFTGWLMFFSSPLMADQWINHASLESLNNDLQSMCKYQQFSGAVLLAIDDKIIFKKACGYANRSFKVENTIDTQFNLGSVSKLFTSVAIAQLIQENKLTLSTPFYNIRKKWLPDALAKQITIQQLLIHTSGLGNFMEDKRWKTGADDGLYVSITDHQSLISDQPLLYAPGSSQSYSNSGYILLGAVIEKLSHQSYEDYLEQHIFKASEMKHTSISRLDEVIPNRAEGYTYFCNQGMCRWKNNFFQAPFVGTSAGGAYSTVDDLFLFSKALHTHKLLNASITHALLSGTMLTTAPDVSVNLAIKAYKINNIEVPENYSPYGFAGAWNTYGLAVWDHPALVGHTGGTAGVSAFFATSPDAHYTIIILSNMSSSGSIILYKKIRQLFGFTTEIVNY